MEEYRDDSEGEGDSVSLFTGLLVSSRCAGSKGAPPAQSLQLPMPRVGEQLILPPALTATGAQHRPATSRSSSAPRTFSRGKSQAAEVTVAASSRSLQLLTTSAAAVGQHSSRRDSCRADGGSCSLQPLGHTPLRPLTAAAASVDGPTTNNSSTIKALTPHQLQLSAARPSKPALLSTGSSTSNHKQTCMPASSRQQHLQEQRSLSSAPEGGAELDDSARGSGRIVADGNAGPIGNWPIVATDQHWRPQDDATAGAASAAAAGASIRAIGSQVSAKQNRSDSTRTRLAQQPQCSRPPRAPPAAAAAVKTAPRAGRAGLGAVTGTTQQQQGTQQPTQKGKGFQLTLDLFAAGTKTSASKPPTAAPAAAAGGSSQGKGSLLLPLPCSIPTVSNRDATAAGSAAAERVQHPQHRMPAGKRRHAEEVSELPVALPGQQASKQQQQQQCKRRKQLEHLADDYMYDIESEGDVSDGKHRSPKQQLKQQQPSHKPQQQQRPRQHNCAENSERCISEPDSDIEHERHSKGLLQGLHKATNKQHLQYDEPEVGFLSEPQIDILEQQQQQQPQGQRQQVKHSNAVGGYTSEPESEVEPPSSSDPSADSGSEWSGGSSAGVDGGSSSYGPSSDGACDFEGTSVKNKAASCSRQQSRQCKAGTAHSRQKVAQQQAGAGCRAGLRMQLPVLAAVARSAPTATDLLAISNAAEAAQQGQQQQGPKKGVSFSILPLPGIREAATAADAQVCAVDHSMDQQQRLKLFRKRQNDMADQEDGAEVTAIQLPKGHIRLMQPTAAALFRQNVLLVELPACFDAAGDSGSIGRVVCHRQEHASNSPAAEDPQPPVTAAAAAGAFSLQPLLLPPGQHSSSSAKLVGSAPAKLASRAFTLGAGNSKHSKALAAGASTMSVLEDLSLSDLDGSEHNTGAEADLQSDRISESEGSQDESSDAEVMDDREVTAVTLDLKGLLFSAVAMPLAGTAAVVRINMAGGNQTKASAHVEHMFNASYIRATPAAADKAGDCDDPYNTGLFADDSDQEGHGGLVKEDAYGLAAGFRDEEDEGLGLCSKAGGKGKGLAKGRGGKGKSTRGGKGRGGGRAGSRASGGAGRTKATPKPQGAVVKPRAFKRGGTSTAAKRGAGGAEAAPRAVEGQQPAKKQRKLEPWEVSDGGSD